MTVIVVYILVLGNKNIFPTYALPSGLLPLAGRGRLVQGGVPSSCGQLVKPAYYTWLARRVKSTLSPVLPTVEVDCVVGAVLGYIGQIGPVSKKYSSPRLVVDWMEELIVGLLLVEFTTTSFSKTIDFDQPLPRWRPPFREQ